MTVLNKCECGYKYTYPRPNKYSLRFWAWKDRDIWYYSEQVIPLISVEMSSVGSMHTTLQKIALDLHVFPLKSHQAMGIRGP